MYAYPGDMCPVQSFKKLIAQNPGNARRLFYQQPEPSPIQLWKIPMNLQDLNEYLTDLEGDSLPTNRKKSGFKYTPTSNLNLNLNSPSTSRKKLISRPFLPTVITPTKRKLLEAKTVKNMISKFEMQPATDPSGSEPIVESPAKRRKFNLIAR